jgi:hypothetical protein
MHPEPLQEYAARCRRAAEAIAQAAARLDAALSYADLHGLTTRPEYVETVEQMRAQARQLHHLADQASSS